MASDFDVEWDEPTKGLGARKVPAKAGGGLKLGGTKPKVRTSSFLKHLVVRWILATSSTNQGGEKGGLIRGGCEI